MFTWKYYCESIIKRTKFLRSIEISNHVGPIQQSTQESLHVATTEVYRGQCVNIK